MLAPLTVPVPVIRKSPCFHRAEPMEIVSFLGTIDDHVGLGALRGGDRQLEVQRAGHADR